jgi:hypothetical protein
MSYSSSSFILFFSRSAVLVQRLEVRRRPGWADAGRFDHAVRTQRPRAIPARNKAEDVPSDTTRKPTAGTGSLCTAPTIRTGSLPGDVADAEAQGHVQVAGWINKEIDNLGFGINSETLIQVYPVEVYKLEHLQLYWSWELPADYNSNQKHTIPPSQDNTRKEIQCKNLSLASPF